MKKSCTRGLLRPEAGEVKITDEFWASYIGKIHHKTIPYIFEKFKETGYLDNFAITAKKVQGEFKGTPFSDGLVFETIRSACEMLCDEYDKALDDLLDEIISLIAAASESSEDGFLCTSTMLCYPNRQFGENGGDIVHQHDLYDQGALVEAATSHYLATKKTTLLIPAIRSANLIARTIPQKGIVPGHSLPEEAFVKLYRLFSDHPELDELAKKYEVEPELYLKTAEFWYDGRGKKPGSATWSFGYHQNHLPFRQQMSAEGHAVRAGLCYAGACAVAREAGRDDFLVPLLSIWENITKRKLHISGGIGTRHDIEGFDVDYNIPNDAYLETCAAIALSFFAAELNLIAPASDRFDIFERAMYNNILAAVGADGKHFFYQNPLISKGGVRRWEWHGCPCCPPMISKFYGSLASNIYTYSESELCVNLYIDSSFKTECFDVTQKCGKLRLSSNGRTLTLKLRKPWYAENFSVKSNGKAQPLSFENGYAVLIGTYDNTEIEVELRHSPRLVCANPKADADIGLVAVMNGPSLMCAERLDNENGVDIEITKDSKLKTDGDCITGISSDGTAFWLIPYYQWAERENSGEMRVWFRFKDALPDAELEKRMAGELYAYYDELI